SLTPRSVAGETKLSRYSSVAIDGIVSIPWLYPEQHLLRVQDNSGQVLATRMLDLSGGEIRPLKVSLDQEPILVRVLGADKHPRSEAMLWIHQNEGVVIDQYTTNSNGVVEVYPADESPIFLCVITQAGEVGWNIPIPEEQVQGVGLRDIVLQCDASLEVELFDLTGPLVGVPCVIAGDVIEEQVKATQATDPQGRATFDKLSAGEYLVQVFLPGYWPYNKLFEAKVDGGVTRIKIPRLADLKVRVEGAGGQPVVGKSITVWSLDYDKDVKRWWEVGALDPSPVTWMTDEQGEFVIPVMPEGPFRVSCPGAETTITLVPDGENLATLRLDS
ncbi:MAG: hypothetical protein P1V35_15600, partial [Planctomycetota bacterium]|nr:hypothetical protein [Planctomycetota bacterium]